MMAEHKLKRYEMSMDWVSGSEVMVFRPVEDGKWMLASSVDTVLDEYCTLMEEAAATIKMLSHPDSESALDMATKLREVRDGGYH